MTYNELTRRCFEHPVCAGSATGVNWTRGEAGSRERGTWVQFDVQMTEGDAPSGSVRHIGSVRFLAFGCPHVIAVCQWVAENAIGLAADPRLPESAQALRRRFEVPTEKLGRLLIVEDAWAAAVRGILRRNA